MTLSTSTLRTLTGLWLATVVVTAAPAQGILYGIDAGAGDGSSNLFQVVTPFTNPTAVDLGETGRTWLDLAIHPITGVGYAIDAALPHDLYQIDLGTRVATLVGPTGLSQPNALEVMPCGTLVAWSASDSWIYTIDPTTAVATPSFDTTLFSAGDLALDVDGILWAAEAGDRLVRIDLRKKMSIVVGTFGVGPLEGLECDLQGNLIANLPSLNGRPPVFFSIDKNTGTATVIGSLQNDGGLDGVGLAYRGSPELILRADPAYAPVGANLSFITDGGMPSNVAFLYTYAVDGNPLLYKVVGGLFDSGCNWTWPIVVPPGLSGLTVDFLALGFAATGNLAISNIDDVQF